MARLECLGMALRQVLTVVSPLPAFQICGADLPLTAWEKFITWNGPSPTPATIQPVRV